MTISGMGNVSTPLESSDVLPIVRNSTNFKTTLTNIAEYVFNRIGSVFGSGSGISYSEANESDIRFPVSNNGITSLIKLNHIRQFILKWLFNNCIATGYFNTIENCTVEYDEQYGGTLPEGARGYITFGHELAPDDNRNRVPRVFLQFRGDSVTQLAGVTLKVTNVTKQGFKWTISRLNSSGNVVPNTQSFNVSYFAIYDYYE